MGRRIWMVLWLLAALGCTGGAGSGTAADGQSARPGATDELAEPHGGGAAAANDPADQEGEPTATVTLTPLGRDPVSVRVEVARTPEERRRGLMFRKHLDADAGMFFVFDQPGQLSFWMRNTYIPLDMMFVGSDLRVVGIVENAEPETDTSRAVDGASQFVLEVNAGYSREHGIEPGTQLKLEGIELP